MSEVMLWITNREGGTFMVDMYDAESIALTWRFTELNSLETTGSFSRQFRVPNTVNNQKIFGTIFDVNDTGTKFSFSRKAKAKLEVSTMPITYGHIRLTQVINRADVLQEYEITFFAETPDLTRSLGSKKLADLDFTEVQHVTDFDNVTTGDTNWIYALTDRGQKWSQNGEVNSRPVLNTNLPVYPNELTPHLNFKWIWDQIMSEAGFIYDGSVLATELARQWLPCANEDRVQSEFNPQQYLFNVRLSANQSGYETTIVGEPLPSPAEVFDNNNDVSSGVWTAPYTGEFRFKCWVTFNPDGIVSNGQFRIGIRRADTGVPLWTSTIQAIADSGTYNYQSPEIGAGIILGEGQQFEMFIGISSSISVELITDANNNPALGTGWAMVGTGLPVAGLDIDWSLNVPDMTQIDFVKSVIAMQNLVCVPDRLVENKLIFVPFEDYISSGTGRDWTQKLDYKKDVLIKSTTDIQKRKVNFSHKQGSDLGSQAYIDLQRTYGDYVEDGYSIIEGQEPNDFAVGELKIETAFQSIPAIEINGTSIPIQQYVNAERNYQRPLPVCLYNSGTQDIAIYNDGTFAGEIATINIMSHYEFTQPTSPLNDDLNWGPEIPLYSITVTPYNNLFNRYYRSYMGEIYSEDARIMEAYFYLSLPDVLRFQFSDSIFIKDSYWRILEIVDYEVGTNDSTKVILIKRVNIPLDCAVTPVNVSQSGLVTWIDASGDPASGTKGCCRRYGYFWIAANNTCVGIPPSNTNRLQLRTLMGFSEGQDVATDRSFIAATGSQISRDSNQSVITGSNIQVDPGNYEALIVGDTIQVIGDQRGVAVLGKNAVVNTPGWHLGGGWLGDERETIIGQQQMGSFIMSNAGDYAASGDDILLTIDGIKDKHISLVDDVVWSVEFNLAIVDSSGGVIGGTGHAMFLCNLYKAGGVAGAGTLTTVHQSSTHGNYSLVIDTTTDTTEHRINVRSTGGGSYPYNGLTLVLSVNYVQVRIES